MGSEYIRWGSRGSVTRIARPSVRNTLPGSRFKFVKTGPVQRSLIEMLMNPRLSIINMLWEYIPKK